MSYFDEPGVFAFFGIICVLLPIFFIGGIFFGEEGIVALFVSTFYIIGILLVLFFIFIGFYLWMEALR